MKHIRIIVGLIFILGITELKAQTRNGVQVTLPAVKIALEEILGGAKINHYPHVGFYHQRWITDRVFKYKSVCFQHIRGREFYSNGEVESKYSLSMLDYNFGRGMYWNHHEFEDDYAWYTTLGMGVGLGWGTGKNYSASGEVHEQDAIPFATFTVFRLGIGFEKKINKDLVGNFSTELNAGVISYVAINFRLLKNNY